MKLTQTFKTALALALITGATLTLSTAQAEEITLLNVSYDPTREFYE
jgi:ABC-type sulfate transport system substrate-binding protein